ncbi:MAG: hypothetical protein OEL54_04865, partial [Flavobacteriaceae bacterium]|nr:hypothetical protein [Flavobacteriaceae bacterium]
YFEKELTENQTLLPYERSSLLSVFYQLGRVEDVKYEEKGILITHKMTSTNQKILASSLAKN